MEFFKYLLFGLAGLSMIFWVCVIALWHTYMFPRFFSEEQHDQNVDNLGISPSLSLIKESGLIDRGKYSNRSFVIADFNEVTETYGVNRLSILVLFSLAIMSFLMISYGLHSVFTLYGIN